MALLRAFSDWAREVKLLRCVLAVDHLTISFQWVTRFSSRSARGRRMMGTNLETIGSLAADRDPRLNADAAGTMLPIDEPGPFCGIILARSSGER